MLRLDHLRGRGNWGQGQKRRFPGIGSASSPCHTTGIIPLVKSSGIWKRNNHSEQQANRPRSVRPEPAVRNLSGGIQRPFYLLICDNLRYSLAPEDRAKPEGEMMSTKRRVWVAATVETKRDEAEYVTGFLETAGLSVA